jgi:hypothetical protein
MLSLNTATALKNAGLKWSPLLHDAFIVPDVGLDERTFVLTEMMAEVSVLKGWPAITFHGVVEWALDYVLQTEVVWIPREDQLRTLIEEQVSEVQLTAKTGTYTCQFEYQDTAQSFTAASAVEAYAAGLLFLLG